MQDRDFQVSAITTPATDGLLDAEFLEAWLNENFRLVDFGDGLGQLFLLFSVVPEAKDAYFQWHADEQMLEVVLYFREKDIRDLEQEKAIAAMTTALSHVLGAIPGEVVPEYDLAGLTEAIRNHSN